jgi:hypothetical protein
VKQAAQLGDARCAEHQGTLGGFSPGHPHRHQTGDIADIHLATNLALLGMVSWRRGRSLDWDGEKERVIGDEAANALLSRPYRKGWDYPKV